MTVGDISQRERAGHLTSIDAERSVMQAVKGDEPSRCPARCWSRERTGSSGESSPSAT